jgi:hypothetical protein
VWPGETEYANGSIFKELFDMTEMRDIVIQAHKADKGQQENAERLEAYLAILSDQA